MLTDVKVRGAKPGDKPYKLPDAAGLHLFVTPAGFKSWRFRYQKDGKETLVTLGSYPDLSLKEARDKRDELRHKMRNGVSLDSKPKPTPVLRDLFERWLAINSVLWSTEHIKNVKLIVRIVLLSEFADTPVGEITAPALVAALRKHEKRSPELARRARGYMERMFAHAIGEGLMATNPASMIASVLVGTTETRHRPAAQTLEEARRVVAAVEDTNATTTTLLALRMLALTAVRPGEVCGMRWDEVTGDVWTIPATRMKMRKPHVVALSRQAMDILRAISPRTGFRPHVFPSVLSIDGPIRRVTLSCALKSAGLGGQHVPHGWRAAFSTIMNEKFPDDRLVIDMMLAHQAAKGNVERAYNRAEYLDRRRELSQVWADMLLAGMPTATDLVKLSAREG